jgi:hypothetical protein
VKNPHVYANQARPRMLHRTDCPHQVQGVSVFRPATPTEARTLKECRDCAHKEYGR